MVRGCVCAHCENKIGRYEDFLECCQCAGKYHLRCVNVTDGQFLESRERDLLKNWKCLRCGDITKDIGVNATICEAPTVTNSGTRPKQTTSREKPSLEKMFREICDSQVKLFKIIEKPCSCTDQIVILRNENTELKNIVSAQTKLIEQLRGEMQAQFDLLKSSIVNTEQPRMAAAGNKKSMHKSATEQPRMAAAREEENIRKTAFTSTSPKSLNKEIKQTTMDIGDASVNSQRMSLPNPSAPHSAKDAQPSAVVVGNGEPRNSAAAMEPKSGGTVRGERRPFLRGTANITTASVDKHSSDPPTFAAVARQALLYVGNVDPQATEENVSTYLRGKFPEFNISVESLPKRESARSRAFKVATDFANLTELYNPEVWPTGVVVKRFFRPKTRGGAGDTRQQEN